MAQRISELDNIITNNVTINTLLDKNSDNIAFALDVNETLQNVENKTYKLTLKKLISYIQTLISNYSLLARGIKSTTVTYKVGKTNVSVDHTYSYEIWSDGWCKMNGKIPTVASNNIQTIWFPIAFKDAKIFVNATPAGSDLGDNFHQGIYVKGDYQVTNEYFVYRSDLYKGETIFWTAEGYICDKDTVTDTIKTLNEKGLIN